MILFFCKAGVALLPPPLKFATEKVKRQANPVILLMVLKANERQKDIEVNSRHL